MPIYDVSSVGTRSEIGSYIYAVSNAGTRVAVQSIYDSTSAGTRSAIWTSETQIYPGASVSVTTQWGDAGSSGAFYVSLSSATINTNSRQAFIAINLSLYRSLRVTYYFTTTANQWANAGMYLHTSSYYAYYTIAKPASYPQYWTRQARITGGTTSGTVTWDVSGLSGTYYLLCGCYLEASITSGMTARIDQVVGIS